jgi:hypothetical protein
MAMRRMQDALHRYDDRVSEVERKWGVDRLIWVVGGDLRDRFEAQMDLLNAAIDKMEDVEHQVDVTLRGVAALEQAAIAAGVQPLGGEWIEGRMPDGRVLAIVPNDYEVSRVKRDNREMVVYSVDEIGKLLAEWDESKTVDAVKAAFHGATVEKVRTRTEKELNDEIPF